MIIDLLNAESLNLFVEFKQTNVEVSLQEPLLMEVWDIGFMLVFHTSCDVRDIELCLVFKRWSHEDRSIDVIFETCEDLIGNNDYKYHHNDFVDKHASMKFESYIFTATVYVHMMHKARYWFYSYWYKQMPK